MKILIIPFPNKDLNLEIKLIDYDILVKWLKEQIKYYDDPPTYCGLESMKEYYLKKDVFQEVLAYVIRDTE
jgi:hypothetical protein